MVSLHKENVGSHLVGQTEVAVCFQEQSLKDRIVVSHILLTLMVILSLMHFATIIL